MFEVDDRPAGRDDPLYREGRARFQAGEWQAAIRCFEALAGRYPDDREVADMLAQARFKARLDAGPRVRPKGRTIRWRPILIRVLAAVLVALAALLVFRVLNEQVRPAMARAQAQQALERLVVQGQDYLKAGKLVEARAAFEEVLRRDPANATSREALAEIAGQEQLKAACEEAEALFQAGALDDALRKFTDLSIQASGLCNARTRIKEISDRRATVEQFQLAEDAFAAGDCSAAVLGFDQVRQLDTTYQAQTVSDKLYECHVRLGLAIVELDPPALDRLGEAEVHFTQALQERPKDATAGLEQRLAGLVLAAQRASEAGRTDDVIVNLAAAVDARPGYLGGLPAGRLYEAYLLRGDQYRDAADYGLAYDMYRRASEIPGIDAASARSRLESVRASLTPTPTPSNTPTPTLIPTPTPYRPPAPATPAPPLQQFRGQIVFRADKEGYEGFWVMNPDGSNKRFLGAGKALEKEFLALYEREQFSPDGRWKVYATKDPGRGDRTVNLYIQGKDDGGTVTIWRVTNFSQLCYDPVWAPDGSRIAFVSQERGSDDIWVINPDGTNAWNYTPNEWEWDKHPSWSPDSLKIVFWTNREGTKQIYVIDADGRNIKKISGVAPWDEYDPIWVK